MPSTFTWLDTSEHDRQRAMELIDLFRRQNTQDELGIGTIRDSIADLLAPGVSTIQTRARYFLFVPWMYLDMERRRVSSADVERRARNEELKLIEALCRSDDPAGTIGIEAGRALKRLPSEVYWGGLRAWRILLLPGSREQYHRSLDRSYRGSEGAVGLRENPEAELFGRANWHPHLPPAQEDFPREASFALSAEESSYLQERIQTHARGSLIAFLSERREPWKPIGFPWEEPLVSSYPGRLRRLVEHARCFSEVLHGAALLYNLMLAELVPDAERVELYREALVEWRTLLSDREAALRGWDRSEFWRVVDVEQRRVPIPTRAFAVQWIEHALDRPRPRGVLDMPAERLLIQERERFLKRERSRLLHREYLNLWGGAAGTDRLDYRWGSAQTIVNDILRGSGATAHAHAA